MALPLLAAASLAPVVATTIKFFVGYAITRVVVALGIGLVTYAALDYVAGQIQSYIEGSVGGLGGQFAVLASALGLFQALNIITSAYVGAIAVRQVMGAYNRITFGMAST